MPTVDVLVGMIGSGKSTYARRRADEGALVVCFDDLTAMLHAAYRYEQELRACYRQMEKSIATAALNAGRDVVVDRTHLTLEARDRWVDFGLRCTIHLGRPVPVVAVAFPVEPPAVHARRRFEADPRGRSHEDWYMVAQHHYAQWLAEPLSASEGFSEIREAPQCS
jgi:hypothetical protein